MYAEPMIFPLDANGRIYAIQDEKGITSHSKVIIEACRPFPWFDKFPPTSALSLAEAQEIEEKWGDKLK